jgi:hypothetical protein
MTAMICGFKNIYSRKYHRQRGGGVRRETLRIKRRKASGSAAEDPAEVLRRNPLLVRQATEVAIGEEEKRPYPIRFVSL